MFNINLEQICFSLNNNCNHNCNDCYVDCKSKNSKYVTLTDVELFLDFIIKNNKSNQKHISIDFMGGEMSEYPYLNELFYLVKSYTSEFIIDDVRVTTYSDISENLLLFAQQMSNITSNVRFFIIRDLNLGLTLETKNYVNRVKLLNTNVRPVVEHVLRPSDISTYANLVKLVYEYDYITLDICYPCGDIDFNVSQLRDLIRIYRDFQVKHNVSGREVQCSIPDINDVSVVNIVSRVLNDRYIYSKCKPFTSELWLSPSGNIFPCAHMIKYDNLFNHNHVSRLSSEFFYNDFNNKFILDLNDKQCLHCSVKPFCLQCKILPEILDMNDLNNINRVDEKCNRVFNHIKTTLEVMNEYSLCNPE